MPQRIRIANYEILSVRCESEGLKVHDQGRDDWIVYVPSAGQDGLAKYHLHVIFNETIPPDKIEKVLPKSSNWRNGNEPDLTDIPYDQWAVAVSGTDSRTQEATSLFLQFLRRFNYQQE